MQKILRPLLIAASLKVGPSPHKLLILKWLTSKLRYKVSTCHTVSPREREAVSELWWPSAWAVFSLN